MLKKDELLRRTNNGLDVFKHFIPGKWRVGRKFLNPLCGDRKASCMICFNRRKGRYLIKWSGENTYHGDCFDFVGMLKGLNCRNPKDCMQILRIINHDLNLALDYKDAPLVVSRSLNPTKKSKPRSKKLLIRVVLLLDILTLNGYVYRKQRF